MSTLNVNRENAQHSTGPKTVQGKARTRYNAFRHGLTGQTVVMPWEDSEAYEAFCAEFIADLHPEGMLEKQVVQTIIDTTWRLNRAATQETNILCLAVEKRLREVADPEGLSEPFGMAVAFLKESQTFSNISLYGQRLSKQREKAIEQLHQLQAQRRQAPAKPEPNVKPEPIKSPAPNPMKLQATDQNGSVFTTAASPLPESPTQPPTTALKEAA
jgi:hypothetical protein